MYYLGQCAKECCDLEPGTVRMISKRQSLTMCKPEFALACVTTTVYCVTTKFECDSLNLVYEVFWLMSRF